LESFKKLISRKRRVKCDETKPGCIRCQNLGQECSYTPEMAEMTKASSKNITPTAIYPQPMSIMAYSPSATIPGDPQERRYFQPFCDKTSKEVRGALKPIF
jgi:hypothetical protein